MLSTLSSTLLTQRLRSQQICGNTNFRTVFKLIFAFFDHFFYLLKLKIKIKGSCQWKRKFSEHLWKLKTFRKIVLARLKFFFTPNKNGSNFSWHCSFKLSEIIKTLHSGDAIRCSSWSTWLYAEIGYIPKTKTNIYRKKQIYIKKTLFAG